MKNQLKPENTEMEPEDDMKLEQDLRNDEELKNLEQFVKRREQQKQVLKKLLEQNDAKRMNDSKA